MYKNGETIPVEDHFIDIGEAVAVTNSVTIAEALERAARSGLERTWVNDQFETIGNEELANIVLEVVSQNGMDWIWKEYPVVDIVDIVDPIDIADVDVTLGSIDN